MTALSGPIPAPTGYFEAQYGRIWPTRSIPLRDAPTRRHVWVGFHPRRDGLPRRKAHKRILFQPNHGFIPLPPTSPTLTGPTTAHRLPTGCPSADHGWLANHRTPPTERRGPPHPHVPPPGGAFKPAPLYCWSI